MNVEAIIQEGITLFEILAIDVALSGDNAIAVGLAAAGLPVEQRRKVIFWGLAGAVVLRVVFALVAAKLLLVPGLQLLGGVLLVWVGYKLLRELREQDAADTDHDGKADQAMVHPKTLTSAIVTVMIANLSMSLDNVLAVAGAAHGHLAVLALGLLAAIGFMAFAADLIANLLQKHRWIGYGGVGVIYLVAATMVWHGGLQVWDLIAL
ncbi:YjbE family putative metal transport protein [Candidatus Phycosocius spiralis]|uniref:Membrane protein n=1 Tax=Candidatus Phycosocius spiralis TaxID=2815099 RepID=A0ABQ4PYH4_9PROT|nr:YjbE family putative metal transport protein [Candidatus Phycosocius spiralis]GIU68129.1 membrane protein [Candidatus Phycosocius spiralis]